MMIEGIGRKDDRIISILRIKALLKTENWFYILFVDFKIHDDNNKYILN
jgi:hypothetical protein